MEEFEYLMKDKQEWHAAEQSGAFQLDIATWYFAGSQRH
jgi:hypothetical protein